MPDNEPGHSRCPTCGFRVRGPNHSDGPHHKGPGRGKQTDPAVLQSSGRKKRRA